MKRRLVLIGASGVFGARLARLLGSWPDVELVLAARRPGPLQALVDELGAGEIAVFDRAAPDEVAGLRPWAVVDVAGPFQESDYRLPLAALRAGAHYVDLADGRAFVAGFQAALDVEARRAGRLAVTGASSTPALSNAALDALTAGWTRIERVNIAISPGARAPQGRSVIRSILSYVGRPVRAFRAGAWRTEPGWSALRLQHFPGVGRRWSSLCETPDLDIVPPRLRVADEVVFRAGTELAVLHLGLWLLSWPVRLGLIRSLTPLAGPLGVAAGWTKGLGSDRGGMIVEATGRDAVGEEASARWALWAEANAGPVTPTAAAAAILRALKDGRLETVGAHACVGLVDLEAIVAELAGLPIQTRIDRATPTASSLFPRVLGAAFETLPAAVQRLHAGEGTETFEGSGRARGSRSPIPWLGRRLAGLPEPGRYRIGVEVAPDRHGERWTRRFGPYRFATRLRARPELGVFEETFGPVSFAFEAQPTGRGFQWRFVSWRLGPLPLPKVLAPSMRARAMDLGGGYRFSVAVAHPLAGLVFAYAGRLAPKPAES